MIRREAAHINFKVWFKVIVVEPSTFHPRGEHSLGVLIVKCCLFVWWCFSATFTNISVILWRSVYWWRKPENPENTTDLSQVTDKLYHIMLYTSPWSRFELTTSVVIGTDYIGSCKTNYHTITATTAPWLLRIISQRRSLYLAMFHFVYAQLL